MNYVRRCPNVGASLTAYCLSSITLNASDSTHETFRCPLSVAHLLRVSSVWRPFVLNPKFHHRKHPPSYRAFVTTPPDGVQSGCSHYISGGRLWSPPSHSSAEKSNHHDLERSPHHAPRLQQHWCCRCACASQRPSCLSRSTQLWHYQHDPSDKQHLQLGVLVNL